jgi:hypothetical protein
MKTTIVELITTARVLVPITHADATPARLVEAAEQAYTEAIEMGIPFDTCIESLEHGRITNADDKPDTLAVIQRILEEYHRIRPGMQWYNDNGHPVSDGEVMLKAIGHVVQRLGYVMVAHDRGDYRINYQPDILLGVILRLVTHQTGKSDIIGAIANTIEPTHDILTAEEYFEQLEREMQPADILQEA